MIKLTVDGAFGFYGTNVTNENSSLLRYSSGADVRNAVYQHSVWAIELGSGVSVLGAAVFRHLGSLRKITIPAATTNIAENSFYRCYSLSGVVLSGGMAGIGAYAFCECRALRCVVFPHRAVTILDGCFNGDAAIRRMQWQPAQIAAAVLANCTGLSSLVIPSNVTSIGANAFLNCNGVKFYDFTGHTAVTTLANANAFTGIADDCEIRVPASLVDSWGTATNWSTYADHIVGVST